MTAHPTTPTSPKLPAGQSLAGASLDPDEDGKSNVEHLTDCEDDGCDRCRHLIDGFYMACDHCGHWGMQESDGWTMCRAMIFCNERCRDAYFGCDASNFSETEPIHSPHNVQVDLPPKKGVDSTSDVTGG